MAFLDGRVFWSLSDFLDLKGYGCSGRTTDNGNGVGYLDRYVA